MTDMDTLRTTTFCWILPRDGMGGRQIQNLYFSVSVCSWHDGKVAVPGSNHGAIPHPYQSWP